ncbi:MAG TPA: phage holin family protein [Terriglobales bacterium]
MKLLIRWLLSAAALMVIAYFVPGFYVRGFGAALIAAAIIGLVNATLGLVLKVLTFPLTIITLGLFLIVINAAMLKVAAFFVPGFQVNTWTAAIIGAILLSLISSFLHWLLREDGNRYR